jgi:hypothetical protein
MRFFFSKMLENISGKFGNFSLLGKVINVDFFPFLPKRKIGHSEKSRGLKFIDILGVLIQSSIITAPYKC